MVSNVRQPASQASENSLIIQQGEVQGQEEALHMLHLTANDAAIQRLGVERADSAHPHPGFPQNSRGRQ